MFLRNKLAILSVTLMSLMTIPTLAENDNSTVTSRIENTKFDVQVKTPEGWSETQDFNQVIPETFEIDGLLFSGLKFRNGTENHGCAVFFAENNGDDESEEFSIDENLTAALAQAQELAFPGAKISSFTVSKVFTEGRLEADVKTEFVKVELKGTLEGNLSRTNGDSTKLTINGTLTADSTKDNCVIGTGQIVSDGVMPFFGTTGVRLNDDYQVIIIVWGHDAESQLKDTHRFLKAITVTAKAPAEIVNEPVTELTRETLTEVKPVAEVANETAVISESVVEEVEPTTPETAV